MTTILLTGATGLVGSAIGIQLLSQGHDLLCIGRGGDARQHNALATAAAGFGVEIPRLASRVAVRDWKEILGAPRGSLNVAAAWHCAADMSFSPMRLGESFDFNVRDTLGLYEALVRGAPNQPRFFYVSSTYTGGLGKIPEALHFRPMLNNPYSITKWGAEMSLAARAQAPHALPTTIFRSPVVVGHTQNGWYGGKSYGLYSFLDAVEAGLGAGATTLRFDIDPDVAHDYAPIDMLSENAARLTVANDQPFSVLHATGSSQSNAWRMDRIARGYEIPIHFGPLESTADKVASRNMAFNKMFNQKGLVFDFASGRLANVLGDRYVDRPLTEAVFDGLVRGYRRRPAASPAADA